MSEIVEVSDDDVRVGDDERRAVDERLHRAVGAGQLTLSEYDERARDVWGARTRGDLAAVVRDLPSAPPAVPAPPAGTRRAVAVMGEERLAGTVAPGQAVEGYAVMGSAKLDLVRDDLPAHVRVRAVAVMGEVEVLVPEGATVELSGACVMGDRSVRVGPAVLGMPVVHLTAYAVMGSVTVRSAGVPTGMARVVAAVKGRLPAPRSAEVAAPGRRRRHRGRTGLIGLGIAGVVLLGMSGSGDDEDRVLQVDASRTITGTTQDTVVVVPDDVRVVLGDQRGEGDVECDEVCGLDRPGSVLTITVTGGTGDVEVVSRSDFADD